MIQESMQLATVERNTRQITRRRSKLTLQHRSIGAIRNRPTHYSKNRLIVVQMIGRTTTTTPLLPHTPDKTCKMKSMMKTMRRNELLRNYPIGSWADDQHHESYAVETVVYGEDELHEGFTYEELLNMQRRDETDQGDATWGRTRPINLIGRARRPSININPSTSIDVAHATSLDIRYKKKTTVREKDKFDNEYLIPDEFEISELLERASRDEPSYICLPEHANLFRQTKLVPEIYTKDEINEMFYGVCGEQENNKEAFQMKLDGVYHPLNDSIGWEEIDQLVEGIYRALETTEERLDGRCDDIYFPMDLSISALTSKIEAMQEELVEIQSYIVRRPEASASIDRRNNKSTDIHHRTSVDDAKNRGRLVPKVTSDMSDTHHHGEEILADTYAILRRHQFNLERIENTIATMKVKWRRGDEAMRDFTGTRLEQNLVATIIKACFTNNPRI
ncbi:hypothetical protein F2Q69_00030865 [Brassica cretica]|uniref:Uncharacterized protein n=1 Tax=Brassica cretica TaxID=69181 RepID=A0A8S9RVH0_BRACR|nr:hypothetical protein F2Q69_00030865 [Brassica cretica]